MNQLQAAYQLSKMLEKKAKLIKEYARSKFYEKAEYHLVQYDPSRVRYMLVRVKDNAQMVEGIPSKVRSWVELRGIHPDNIIDYSLIKPVRKMKELTAEQKIAINTALETVLGVDETELHEEAVLSDTLAADSLDMVEIELELEKYFDIPIDFSDGNVNKDSTVGQLHEYVRYCLSEE